MRIKFKLLSDFNMIIFSEKGIIVGITEVVCHYAEANNKCMFDYDKSKKIYYILILTICMDMLQPLPYGQYEVVEYLLMFTFDFIMNYDKESDISYALLIDVDYPVYFKPLQRDLPFAPEKRVINGVIKLVCTFYNKKNYLCGIELLQQALKHS